MKIVMDADCLIKLTKSGLKEAVCSAWSIAIPRVVETEIVTAGAGRPDAELVRENIELNRIAVWDDGAGVDTHRRGEDAVLAMFRHGGYAAVASDDARFIRRLRVLSVPFAVPAVIIVLLHRDGVLTDDAARAALEELRQHISPDQYATGVLMLTGGGEE